jgi:hypothetical protein
MNFLERLAEKLKTKRGLIVLPVILGMVVTGTLIAFVPSQLGFILAGPLVVFPWAMLCAAFAHNLSRLSLIFLATFAMFGLAWPLLYI